MDSYSGNNQYRSVRLPQWGDDVRLRSIASASPFSAAETEPEERMDTRTSQDEEDRWEERSSYRRRREAEDDGWRKRDAASDRGSVWERGATAAADSSDRSRREHVSAYLDESSVVRVTRRSSRRSDQWADASDGGRQRRTWRGFSLVGDEPDARDQRDEQRSGSWAYSDNDTFDDDFRAVEAAASTRWGSTSSDAYDGAYSSQSGSSSSWRRVSDDDASGSYGSSDTFDDDFRAAEAAASTRWGSTSSNVYDSTFASDSSAPSSWRRVSDDEGYRTNDASASGSATSARWGYASSDAFDSTREPASRKWTFVDDMDDDYGAGSSYDDARASEADSSSSWRRVSDDAYTSEADAPTRRRRTPVDAADLDQGYDATSFGADDDVRAGLDYDSSRSTRNRTDDEDEPRGIWAIVDAVCFVPEAVGTFVLGTAERLRTRGLVAIIIAILVSVTLYNPVRDLYLAHRRLDTLQKTYEAISAENEQLEHEIEVLQTREGIENEARERGYVEPGETKVVVKGLTTEGGASTYTITETEVPDDRPWYIVLLDDFFGYDPKG